MTGYGLIADGAVLALTRRVVATSVGPVVVHAGPADGPATVLIHGAAGSWTTWTPLLQQAAADGASLPGVVALDLPGWGGSPAPAEPLTAEAAARVVAEVAAACGHERWTAVGHSLGGFVALELAAREPGRTDGVVLVSPTGPAVVEAVRHPIRGGLRLPWFAGMLAAMRTLAALPGEGRGLLRAFDRAGILARLGAPLFHDGRDVDRTVTAALASEIRPRAFIDAARAATRVDLGSWARIRCPVQSIRGEHDVFVGPHDAADLLRLLPDFAETVLPDAGHFAAVERPTAVLAALDAVRR